MSEKRTESCGRCAMSTVVDATASDEGSDSGARDPMAGGRIELAESELRAASPAAWFSGVVSRIDDAATAFIHGDR
ncbi:hypothetical protein SAMN04488063_3563 [Halopelagius inordinatus]|uniref:Uncharacterized protein n=2 Tax=Halopelagius inordinatus TaxID=553467 RepID=A0A1I2WHC3_9EURY|nr:hypothetical protein [Halopelagius inordinatus]SFH00733.1 hypothetical protein SAMN04488063_3563 [Halopelagius inordinatus]